MTEEELRRLLQDPEFGMLGLEKSQIPIGAGGLRTILGGGLLPRTTLVPRGGTVVGGARTPPGGGGRRVIEGETIPVPRGRLPAPNKGRGFPWVPATMLGVGAASMYDREPPMVQADDVVIPGTGESGISNLPVGEPPVDSWTVPGGMQTGLDYIADRRNFYFDTLNSSFKQAAILNLMEKGLGDKFIEGTEATIKDMDELADDEYIAKINKAVFSKPFKTKRELFDRLIKIVPAHVASKISGHVPEKGKNVNWINPETGEKISSPANQSPGKGFRLVDPVLDKKISAGTGTGQERVLSEASRMAATNFKAAVEYLAGHLFYKQGERTDMDQARRDATDMLKAYQGEEKSGETKEEYEAAVRKKHPNASEEDIKATVEAKYGG